MPTDQADSATATDAHPYKFNHLSEVGAELHDHVFQAGSYKLARLMDIASAMRGLSFLLLSEAGEPSLEQDKMQCLELLVGDLSDLTKGMERWHARAHALSVIVHEGDVNALDRYPHLQVVMEEEAWA